MNYTHTSVKLISSFVSLFKGISKAPTFIAPSPTPYGIDLLCVMFEFHSECKIRTGLPRLKIVSLPRYRFCFIERVRNKNTSPQNLSIWMFFYFYKPQNKGYMLLLYDAALHLEIATLYACASYWKRWFFGELTICSSSCRVIS